MEGRTDETMAAFHLHVLVDHNRERMLEIKAAGRFLIVQNPVPQIGSWSFWWIYREAKVPSVRCK